MPDHLHLLVEGLGADSNGRRLFVRAKQLSGHAFARVYGERLWQRYGYERVLRRGDDVLAVARYILENPVRAGLARAPADYPFSGCPEYGLDAILEAMSWRPRSG